MTENQKLREALQVAEARMSSDLRTLVEQEVELTHSELEDCFKQAHRILQTEYSRFAPGWVEYGHQVNKAVMSKVRAIIAAHEAK